MGRRKLSVCFDARKFSDGGIGVYIRNTIYGLLQQPVDITLLTNNTDRLSRSLEDTTKSCGIDALESFSVEHVEATPFSRRELFSLRHEVDWSRFDLFHTPNYSLPFGIPCPTLITVHDLIHLRHPERRIYPFLAGPLLYSSLWRADRILCVSNATCGDLRRFCRFSKHLQRKISVISNALCPSFAKRNSDPEMLRSRFNLKTPYFLSVLSSVKPHKGVMDLLEAFKILETRRQKGRAPELVLVGQGTENLIKIEQLLKSADALKHVRLLGAVKQDELYQLYQQAEALIVPSFREGFCLPVIEAQSVETPVIIRPIPAVIENISPRDIICEDFTVDGLVSGIDRFLELRSSIEGAGMAEYPLLTAWQAGFRARVDPITLGSKLFDAYREVIGWSEERVMPEEEQREVA